VTDPLTELALHYGTDKARDHWYTPHYERRFREMREAPITLLEIGVGGYATPSAGGKSLRMWRDYFPNAVIVGLDCMPQDAVEGCFIELGDQGDPAFLCQLGARYDGFDIVVDDGSHRPADHLRSWWALWPFVREGGWYCIEDIGTAYIEHYGGSMDNSETSIGMVQGLVDAIHHHERYDANHWPSKVERSVVELNVTRNLVMIRKGDNA
jgi:hypothetical protein